MDALIIWDARSSNKALENFMSEFTSELSRFAMNARIVCLSETHRPAQNKIKASMRALLNLIQDTAPHYLITFGSRPNSLAALLRPTLKCHVLTNTLPIWLDDDVSSQSLITKLSQWLVKNATWDDMRNDPDYVCVKARSNAATGILLLEDDPRADELANQLDQEALPYRIVSETNFFEPTSALLEDHGVMAMSYEASANGRWIDQANAYGMPVMLLIDDDRQHGIIEGQTGWVIGTNQALQFKHCLSNWRTMSDDARAMISHYCRDHISQHSGLRQYCASLGYPERLEFKDFKIRG